MAHHKTNKHTTAHSNNNRKRRNSNTMPHPQTHTKRRRKQQPQHDDSNRVPTVPSPSSSSSTSTSTVVVPQARQQKPIVKQLPGYYYDENLKKYFKIDKQSHSFQQIYANSEAAKAAERKMSELKERKTQTTIPQSRSFPLLMLNRSLHQQLNNTNLHKINKQTSDTAFNYRISQMESVFSPSSTAVKMERVNPHNLSIIHEHYMLSSEAHLPTLFHFNEDHRIIAQSPLIQQVNKSDVSKILYSSMFGVAIFCHGGNSNFPGQLLMSKFDLNAHPIQVSHAEHLISSRELTYWTCQWYQNNMNHYYDSLRQVSTCTDLSIGTSRGGLLLDLTTQKVKSVIQTQKSDVFSQVFADENSIWNGCRDGFVRLYDQRSAVQNKQSGKQRNAISNTVQQIKCSSSIVSLQMSPNDKNELFTCTAQGEIQGWDIRNGDKPVLQFQNADPTLIHGYSIPFTLIPSYWRNDNLLLYADDKSGSIFAWDTNNAKLLFSTSRKACIEQKLVDICCTSTGSVFFSLDDRTIRVMD